VGLLGRAYVARRRFLGFHVMSDMVMQDSMGLQGNAGLARLEHPIHHLRDLGKAITHRDQGRLLGRVRCEPLDSIGDHSSGRRRWLTLTHC